MRPLILASASPRRAELLKAAGIPVEVVPAEVDEDVRPGEGAEGYVGRLSLAKARAVAAREPDRVVIGADTTVVVDDTILGKPVDEADARRMLTLLSGRRHEVLTGVALVQGCRGTHHVRVACTTVEFSTLTPDVLAWYIRSGEPFDKAGAYAIQGRASRFVARIEGSYSNVVGLPVALLCEMCGEAGILLS